jgi:phosphotransferase family enzyme
VVGDEETQLAGGNLTSVVRVGDTVRRAAGPWTPMVHELLRHIRDRGFLLGPVPLGIDDQGREVLSYLPGETVTAHPWPRWVWADGLLIEAVKALSSYHGAVADFRPATVESRLGVAPLQDGQIVCHNDFAPYNCVFRQERLTGIIDWDVLSPGSPAWDLAFFAWHWIPLHPPSTELAWRTSVDCQRRLGVLVDTYGLDDISNFVDQIIERVEASRIGIIERARAGDTVFVRLKDTGHADEMARTVGFIHSIERELRKALSG